MTNKYLLFVGLLVSHVVGHKTNYMLIFFATSYI